MKRSLLFIMCALASMAMWAQENSNDYIPFVELGKQWHVVSRVTNPSISCRYDRFEMSKEVKRNDKTYLHTYRIDDELGTNQDEGLFREEDRRVYKYDETAGKDIMLYDFSLKEGDFFTYELSSGSSTTCKVLKQGWMDDGPEIVTSGNMHRKLRTWTIGSDNGMGEYNEVAIWVEGVGTLENMFCPFYTSTGGNRSQLAYVERNDNENDNLGNDYLPFFLNCWYGPVYGGNMPKVAASNSEDLHNQLTYELNGDSLHVYGKAVLNCTSKNYAYFIQEATDDPLVRKLHFKIEDVGSLATCVSLFTTDFNIPGFNQIIDYIVVDNNGEEHQVIKKKPQTTYRPFVEDGKVWKVGIMSGNPVQMVDYYYFDSDTIINGKTCKQMMWQRYINPEYRDYNYYSKFTLFKNMGAYYEEDKKVYTYNTTNKQFEIMYDFSLEDYGTFQKNGLTFVVGPRQTGGIKGFKGVYRYVAIGDIMGISAGRWLEGVGTLDGPRYSAGPYDFTTQFLMECAVGDELIYFNDEYEDGATPVDIAGARKQRIDFTHTIKEKPQTRTREEAEVSLYGKYNEKLLSINLNPIDEAYMVSITDESGKVVYENPINAGSIVGLNIDISKYPKGNYTVTVENGNESFTGEFKAQLTGIEAIRSKRPEAKGYIYNLQGQRLSSPQKGLNIVNGKKVFIK